MISHLQALIKQAQEDIKKHKISVEKAKKEIEICKQLLTLLMKIGSDASNGSHLLNSAASSLNSGIKIDGVGQGNPILERSLKMMELQTNSENGAANVQKRITELERKIMVWQLMIGNLESSITEWSNEIARLQEEERLAEEAKRTIMKTGGKKDV